jgi:hypothetical protein
VFVPVPPYASATVPEDIALPLTPVLDAVVNIVPLVAGSVTVTVPAVAGADRVTAPDVSPLTTMLAIIFP